MTDLAEKQGRILPIDTFDLQTSLSQGEGLNPAGERKVGWAAGAVFFVWIGLFVSWIFLAAPVESSPPVTEAFPVAVVEDIKPTALPAPSQTPVQVTPTLIPAVVPQNPTETPTSVPPPTFTATVPPPTPVYRSPQALTLLEEEVRAITGLGNTVYLGISNRLVALDVTDPTFPVWIGEVSDLPGTIEQLALVSEHIYALYSGGVSVVDVSEPGDLLQVGSLTTDPGLLDLISGPDGLYGTVGGGQGSVLQVFDVGNPAAPRPSGSTAILNEPFDFKVADELGYLTHGPRLSIFDLEDSTDIQRVGTYEFPGAALSVAPSRGYAFVGVAGSGIHVLRVDDPSTPDLVAVYPLADDLVSIQSLYDGVLVALTGTQVALFDVSQPEALELIGEYPLPGRLQDLQLIDEIAFVAMGESGMLVIDLSQ